MIGQQTPPPTFREPEQRAMTVTERPQDPSQTGTPLTDLVRSLNRHYTKDPAHLSAHEMARRARGRGHRISNAYLSNLALNQVAKAPDAQMIPAIAAALDVAPSLIERLVWQQWFRYDYLVSGTQAGTVEVPADLTADERDQIERLITAWLATRRSKGNDTE